MYLFITKDDKYHVKIKFASHYLVITRKLSRYYENSSRNNEIIM